MRTPSPVSVPLAGEDAEKRSSREGRRSAGRTGSALASRTVLAAGVAGRQLHGADGAPAPRLWSRWLRFVPAWPACEEQPGSDPGVGRMTRPRGGGSPGRSRPASWATPWAWGPVLELPAEGRMPSRGAETAWLPERESPPRPRQEARGRVPGRRLSSRRRTGTQTVDGLQGGWRGGNFLAEVEVVTWGLKGGN